jgi:hypothetical protein
MLVLPSRGAPSGTLDDPIIDCAMTEAEAFDGLDPDCPAEILGRQKIIVVRYYSFDGLLHCGQLVIDQELEDDVQHVFGLALEGRFPIHCVVPISHPRFRKHGRWDDGLSMAANNTSAFNYRPVTGASRLSMHAHGRAIDINPLQNPYLNGEVALPGGARYDMSAPGTLTANHPLVQAFRSRGWQWGGDWQMPRDYQHFEKRQRYSLVKRSLANRFGRALLSKLSAPMFGRRHKQA